MSQVRGDFCAMKWRLCSDQITTLPALLDTNPRVIYTNPRVIWHSRRQLRLMWVGEQ